MSAPFAFFLPALHGGGAERVTLNLARGLVSRGQRVDLVVAKAEGHYASQIPSGVRLINFDTSRVLTSLPSLVRYLRLERPRAMFSAMDHANLVALWASKISGTSTPVVVSVHTTLSHARTRAKKWVARGTPLWIRMFYRWARRVVAVSQGVAEDLIRTTGLHPEHVQVIYNPVLTPEMYDLSNQNLDHPWFQPGEPPVILGVGRLVPEKDFGTLLRAFALVRERRVARLVLLGDGPERRNLEGMVGELGLKDDVELAGFVHNPYNYMKRSSVFVLSSVTEGLPTVLVEALALGVPVVSTDCPSGPREILADGAYGTLVPVGDVERLARAIHRVLELESLNTKATPSVVLRGYTLECALDAYLDIVGGESHVG